MSNPSSPGVDSGSTRNEYEKIFLGGKARPVRKADNLAATCEVIVYKIWDLPRLTTL
jgi:hypothetical protein